VAAAVNHLGGVLGTRSFPTTAAGYRRLLGWLCSFGPLHAVGLEGTGSYGSALARHLTESDMRVIEVSRPNRQVRRRHGKTDVIDAIAAARAVLSGEASATPKAHDGPVEALRLLKIVLRGATKSRTQAANQLRTIVATAPEELRSRMRGLKTPDLVTICAAFRIRAEDDSLGSVTRLALRELAQRIQFLDDQILRTKASLSRITTAAAPELMARKGVGPDTASAILVSAGDNPHRLRDERSFAALAGSNPIPASSGKTTRHRLNRGGVGGPSTQRSPLAHRQRPPCYRSRHPGLPRPSNRGRQDEDRSDPLHQALHRPGSLRRATSNGRQLTVGASANVRPLMVDKGSRPVRRRGRE
jgi:transposase